MAQKAAAVPATRLPAPQPAMPGGQYAQARREFVKNPSAVLGLIVLVAIVGVSVLAPLLTPYDPLQRDASTQRAAPSLEHPMGTDSLGRDILSRVLHGGRVSLLVGFFSVIASTVIGVPLGLIAGYFGGTVDNVIMRIMDVILSFPSLILSIWLVAMLGANVFNVILAITVFSVPTYSRLTRGITLSIREMEYVVAARSMGARAGRILVWHILPGVIGPLVVLTTLSISGAIVTGASLSFLGLGVRPPTPEWGAMLSDGREYMRNAWWMAVFPGMVITLVVLAANIVGDALRDALDPRIRAR